LTTTKIFIPELARRPEIRMICDSAADFPDCYIERNAYEQEDAAMTISVQAQIENFMSEIASKNPNEPEFQQAVYEVACSVIPYISDKPEYREARILERIAEPDRIVSFRVTWEDDQGRVKINKGYRVQNNNAIGPYKGGLRFTGDLKLSILKFLAFEQTFKNSLTGLPMGGGKGGSNFDPKGKSDREVMRFCQSFMTQLFRYIGRHTDVPAGDIGVGAREVSFLFGQYKRLTNEFTGVLTGKGLSFGGSQVRTEATGYGAVYFMEDMLQTRNLDLEGKIALVSGSGNVAQHAIEKLLHKGARPVTCSDSDGFVYDPAGITAERLAWIKQLKNIRRGRISEYAREFGVEYFAGEAPWRIPCDIALPCATQNEIHRKDAIALCNNGCIGVSEGANMPTTSDGIEVYREAGILYGPGKAANAGGVAISGLEMSQNAMHLSWSAEELNKRLRDIMTNIHEKCREYGEDSDGIDYVRGANVGGFVKVADAMLAYGIH
jgi:glutamate dehydrogenase (NADP+)